MSRHPKVIYISRKNTEKISAFLYSRNDFYYDYNIVINGISIPFKQRKDGRMAIPAKVVRSAHLKAAPRKISVRKPRTRTKPYYFERAGKRGRTFERFYFQEYQLVNVSKLKRSILDDVNKVRKTFYSYYVHLHAVLVLPDGTRFPLSYSSKERAIGYIESRPRQTRNRLNHFVDRSFDDMDKVQERYKEGFIIFLKYSLYSGVITTSKVRT
jgi:hypothetical protein